MICLTGDVHNMSLCTKECACLPPGETEVQVAGRYVRLLEQYGVKGTLYTCGRCFTQEWEALNTWVHSSLIEIGGHSYWARQPRKFFDWYGRRTGNWNGPRWFQSWDIRRNLDVCERYLGWRPVSWRAHSYKVDGNTYPLLAQYGVRAVSDTIEARTLHPYRLPEGLVAHPMNVIPDHDHLYHAHRTQEFVAAANRRGYGADDFGAVSYTIEQWGELVLQQAQQIEAQGGVVTILAHPICMYLSDEFRTFERMLEHIATRPNVWAREIPALCPRLSGTSPLSLAVTSAR
jgi:hypothetical protein